VNVNTDGERDSVCVCACVYLALEVWPFILHAAGREDGVAVLLVLLDDGEALTVGPEETRTDRPHGSITMISTFCDRSASIVVCFGDSSSCRLYSLAGVVDGVLGTVSGAVAAEEAGGVLGRYGRVLAGPPSFGFHPRALQDVVRVLTRSWKEKHKQSQNQVLNEE